MARKQLFTDVFETDTFNEWRLKTNSIKINFRDIFHELDTLDSRVVLLTGDQTINGVKSFIQKSKWTKEYTQNDVTPMLELRVTNSNSPTAGSNHKGSGPSIDFYNPDTTASDPGVYGSANATQDTWLASRIASVSERSDSAYSDSSLIFYTSVNVSPLTEKMRITASGNVGIGTSSPAGRLSVQTTTDNSIISIQSRDNKYAAVTFGDSQSHKSGQIQYHNAGNSMRFFTGEDSNITASSNERVRITSAGNVGIGTSSPGAKLDVAGDLRTSGYVEAFPNEGGIALTYDDGYGNANIAFNHTKAIPRKAGSSARITAEVDSTTAAMSLELKDNVRANAAQDTSRIIYLKTDLIDLYKQTRIRGQLNVDNKVGIGGVDYPDYALCVGGKSTEAGHVAIDSAAGSISLRPKKNKTHRWLLNALDTNGGRFNITSGRWNPAKNAYDEIPVISVMTDKQVRIPSKLSVGPSTGSSLPLVVNGGEDAGISGQFGGTIWVNQFSGNTKAHAFLSTNEDSAMVGGNLRLNGSTEAKGTNLRGSSAIKFSQPNGTAGEILFLRAEDSDDGGYNVIESGRFDEAGRLGINVSNPTQSLDVDGNIKGSNKLFLMNDSYPQFVLSDANGRTKRYGIWNSKSIDRMEIGPQNVVGTGIPALTIDRSSIVEIYKGGKLHVTKERLATADPLALVNKAYVDDKVDTGGALQLNTDPSSKSNGYYQIPTLSVQSQNNVDQGGEIGLNRASDNERYWNIDVFGSGDTPSLRVSHENEDTPATEVVTITSQNNVGINENDPDSDLCIGGKSTDAGSVCIDAAGGSIQLRPLKNTTHAWMLNAFDSPNGDAAIVSRVRTESSSARGNFGLGRNRSGYRTSNILTFSSTGTVTANRGDIIGTKGIKADGNIHAGGNLTSSNDAEFGTDASRWLLHTRQNSAATKGDYFTLAPRKSDNSNWDYFIGFNQTRDGSVGIGKLPDAGYKLDVNGSIQYSVGGHIQQIGRVTPTGFNGLTTKDIYSDGGTIAVGKAGDQAVYFNKDGNGFVKNRLTLGYTPRQAADAVTKSYVDSLIAGVSAGASNFSGRTQYDFGGVQFSRTTSHADSVIPKTLVGHSTHGGGFVSKFTTTSGSDGGGIALEVSDSNNDEHAISAYNTNASINKEIFHVRAATGDLYASGNIFNRGNIGTEGNISIGHNADDYYSIMRGYNNTNLSFVHHTKTKTKILLSFSESSGNVHLTKTGTAPTSLVTKAYVDTAVAGVTDLGRDFIGRTNFAHGGSRKNALSTIGSYIPTGDGHSHGGHFVARFSSTSSDSGGISLQVGDTNNDEHAITAYNTNKDKEIFHVRSATGDMYSAGKFYNIGNIGTEGKLHIGKTNDYHYISKRNAGGLEIGYKGTGGAKNGLLLKENGEVVLGKSGTSSTDLVNKKYVDDRIAGVPSGDITTSALSAALRGYYNQDNDGAGSKLDADLLDGFQGASYRDAAKLTGTINDDRLPNVITPIISVKTREINCSTNQELILNAGESAGKISGQEGELVYVNAESGLSVNTPHPRNRNWRDGRSFQTTIITGEGINIAGQKVWHAGNDGDKSGLDADLLDGNHANVFAKSNTQVIVSTPSANNHATTKAYVDEQVAAVTASASGNYKIVSGIKMAVGFTNIVGRYYDKSNYFDVYPPTGYTMSDLEAFMPSIAEIWFAGGVNGDDSMRCYHKKLGDRVRVWVQNTEQRATPSANFIAVWRNS